MKAKLVVTLLGLVLLFSPLKALFASETFTYPDHENIYVNDYAGILDKELESLLYQYLLQVAEKGGPQITLVVIQSLDHYAAGSRIEPFATGLFNHWGVGDDIANDGVMILVSIRDRKMRIELGSGYPSQHNKVMKDIIDFSFIPYFKKDDYPAGIKAGTIEVIHKITGKYPGKLGRSFFARTKFKVSRSIDKLGAWNLAIIAPVFMFLIVGVRKLWRLRPRSCRVCENKMTMMGERADDEHLDGGQRLEEYLDSVDYDVWRCGTCWRIDIYRYKSWFGNHSTCKACKYRTLAADTTVITSATTSSEGLKRIDYHCQNCDFKNTETRTIPREIESSSRSGGSFGGGSSSGGGASGSW